jgi:hypothetical protein
MPIVGSFAGASARAYGLGAGVLVGDFESIANVTAGSAVANVEFTSIPATYSHLQIRGIARGASTTGNVDIQFNGDTATNYSRHYVYGDGSSAASFNAATINFIRVSTVSSSSSTASVFGGFVLDILDYSNTNKYKTARSIAGLDNNGSGEIGLRSGNWRSNSAITSIKLWTGDATNLAQYSSFALYGVKA